MPALHDEFCHEAVFDDGGAELLRTITSFVHESLESDEPVLVVMDRPKLALLRSELPMPGQPGGYGLWLANQLCDLVQTRTFATGSVVRLHMRCTGAASRA